VGDPWIGQIMTFGTSRQSLTSGQNQAPAAAYGRGFSRSQAGRAGPEGKG